MSIDKLQTAELPRAMGPAKVAPLLTIGYGSKRSIEEFIRLLKQNFVEYLVDVRTKPSSKFRPEFSRDELKAILWRAGLVYGYMGDELGGLPNDPSCYTDGKVDYRKVRERAWFLRGLNRLESGYRNGHRIAIMCAESEPHRCHRTKLIGEALVMDGLSVMHIDENGTLITHDAAISRLNGGQPVLFDIGYKSRKVYLPGQIKREDSK